MKFYQNPIRTKISGLFLLFFIVTILTGCPGPQIVADQDPVSVKEIAEAKAKVNVFYVNLLLTDQSNRQYQQYSDQYTEIEDDLVSLYKKNEARPLNDESTKISKSILGLWTKYKEKHKLDDKYSNGNAELDRERFVRLFSSAQSAESAKKM